MNNTNNISTISGLYEMRMRQDAMIKTLNAEHESERVQDFIRFAAGINLDAEKILMLLPVDDIFERCDASKMPADIRRRHMERINKKDSE